MALDARSRTAFIKATSVHIGTGVVIYRVLDGGGPETTSMAEEYNARKLEIVRGVASYGLNALVWWNDSTRMATLRLRLALLANGRACTRVRKFLTSCKAVERFWSLTDYVDHRTWKVGWRCNVEGGKCLDFGRYLTTLVAGIINKRDAQGDAQDKQEEGKDVEPMKLVFPVMVCERKAKKEGGAKEDGDLLEGFAPKFVPAVNSGAAKTKVIVELVAAEKYGDPDDPDVRVEVCAPFAPATQ